MSRSQLLCSLEGETPVHIRVWSTDSMSQVKEKLLNAFRILPHHDGHAGLYDSSNRRLMDVDDRAERQRAGWCRVNTVGSLGLSSHDVLRLDLNVVPMHESVPPAGHRLFHLEKRMSSADAATAPNEALCARLIAFRVWTREYLAVECAEWCPHKYLCKSSLRHLLQDAIKPAVDALVEVMLDTSAAPPPAFKLLLDFLDDKACEFSVPADIVNARWKPRAILHAALLPVVRWPQALLNVRINAATGNRYGSDTKKCDRESRLTGQPL